MSQIAKFLVCVELGVFGGSSFFPIAAALAFIPNVTENLASVLNRIFSHVGYKFQLETVYFSKEKINEEFL